MRKILLMFFLACFSAFAQQPVTTPANPSVATGKELHENVVKLIELWGVRQRMEGSLDQIAQQGKEKILHDYPNYDPAFSEEWAKQMRAQTKVDDYVDVFVRVYEKYFDNGEIVELIQAQRDFKAGKVPVLSPHLKDKLTTTEVMVQSEILGGCTQVGARLGGEIGLEINKKHPEWTKKPKPVDVPATGR